MKKNHIFCLILCCVLLVNLAGCKKTDNLISKAQYPQMTQLPDREKYISSDGTVDTDALIEKNKAWKNDRDKQLNQPKGYSDGLDKFFAVSSKRFLSKAGKENRVYSPLNVFVALGMLAEITDNNSQKQILDLIGLNSVDELRTKVKAVWNANYCDDGTVKSILASSLWLNNNINFKKDTIKSLSDNYYASSFSGEMGSEELNTELQNWLNEQTGDLLKEQASRVTLSPDTVMALATTIFYKANWKDSFSASNTEKRVFHSVSGDIECDFMNQSGQGEYYKGENFSAVNQELRNSGKMWLILPDENVSVDDFLSSDSMSSFFKGESPQGSESVTINKSIPKFDVSSDLDLIQGLKALGVTDVFDSAKADLTPLTSDTTELAITDAKHAARVLIDENGCTGAAYSALMYLGLPDPNANAVNFVLDRPFIFIITSQDGLPLFVSVVNNVK